MSKIWRGMCYMYIPFSVIIITLTVGDESCGRGGFNRRNMVLQNDSKYLLIPWFAVLIIDAALTLQSDSQDPSSILLNCVGPLDMLVLKSSPFDTNKPLHSWPFDSTHSVLQLPHPSHISNFSSSPICTLQIPPSHHASTFSFSEFSTFHTPPLLIST